MTTSLSVKTQNIVLVPDQVENKFYVILSSQQKSLEFLFFFFFLIKHLNVRQTEIHKWPTYLETFNLSSKQFKANNSTCSKT